MKRIAIVVLVAALAITAVIAQQGRGPGGRGAGGPGGGFGGGNMAFGSIVAVDMNAGIITLEGRGRGGPGGGGGQQQTVQLHQDTKILETQPATADDIAVGRHMSVLGVPTGLFAQRATLADAGLENTLTGGMRGGFGFGRGGPGGDVNAMGNAVGEIISVEPLRIQVTEEVVVEITGDENTQLTQLVEVPEGALQQGTFVMCTGQPGQNGGALTADTVQIIDMQQFGGGRGARGPGGGGPAAAPPGN